MASWFHVLAANMPMIPLSVTVRVEAIKKDSDFDQTRRTVTTPGPVAQSQVIPNRSLTDILALVRTNHASSNQGLDVSACS